MTFEYKYGVYNPGQYPADSQAAWDALVAAGWQVDTANPNYNEICILWRREIPEPDPPAASRHRSPQKHRENPAGQTSGSLRSHEGQDAR